MPIPAPRKDEKKKDFIKRCMNNPTMQKEYPAEKQRSAICHGAWDKKHSLLVAYLELRGWTSCQIAAEIARIDRK